jgi:ketosteroid isomerase-like protein
MNAGGGHDMTFRTIALLCALFFAGFAPSVQAADMGSEKSIQPFLDLYAKAAIQNDVPMLDKIYHPDLTYTHITGKSWNKQDALEGGGRASYLALNFHDVKVRQYGQVALVKTILDFKTKNSSPGAPAEGKADILLVLIQGGSLGWQVVARQSIGLPQK